MQGSAMEGLSGGSLPVWAQVAATLIPILAAAWAVTKGYGKGGTAPTPPSATMQVIGGAFADRDAMGRLAAVIETVGDRIEGMTNAYVRDAQDRNRDVQILERAIKNVGEDMQKAFDHRTPKRRNTE